jgi:hypothetical protein
MLKFLVEAWYVWKAYLWKPVLWICYPIALGATILAYLRFGLQIDHTIIVWSLRITLPALLLIVTIGGSQLFFAIHCPVRIFIHWLRVRIVPNRTSYLLYEYKVFGVTRSVMFMVIGLNVSLWGIVLTYYTYFA